MGPHNKVIVYGGQYYIRVPLSRDTIISSLMNLLTSTLAASLVSGEAREAQRIVMVLADVGGSPLRPKKNNAADCSGS